MRGYFLKNTLSCERVVMTHHRFLGGRRVREETEKGRKAEKGKEGSQTI